MENNFSKKTKKILQSAALAAGLSAAPDLQAQSAQPYQAKDDRDYKYRKEMYDDSLRAYNESQKSKQIFEAGKEWEDNNYYGGESEVFLRYAGIPMIEKEKISRLVDLRDKYQYWNAPAGMEDKYKDIYEKYQKAIDLTLKPYREASDKNDKRFQLTSRYDGTIIDDFDSSVYTKFPNKNKPIMSSPHDGSGPFHNESGVSRYPIYKKPRQEILPPIKEELPPTPPVIEIRSSIPEIVVPEVPLETYIMPDGRHYTYDELIKNFPALKDPGVFERNFGKKPPNH